MRLTLALETRFARTPDGHVWSLGWLDSGFWERYLDVFDRIQVAARTQRVPERPKQGKPADHPSVSFADLPYYVGPVQFLARYPAIRRRAAHVLNPDDAVILRAPGTMSTLIERWSIAKGRPYGVEAIGDPEQVFQRNAVSSVLTPWLRRRFVRDMKRQCADACAVAYVTRDYLQLRYPRGSGSFETNFTSLTLEENAFRSEHRVYRDTPSPFRLVSVGTLEQLYKGFDTLIDAVALLRTGSGGLPKLDVVATIVGDGKHRSELEQRAAESGVGHVVRFVGQVTAERVREELDGADAFILPSRTEGLPRAMIEAMARALPCAGSVVGGIPELLGTAELVRPNDAPCLALRITELSRDPARLTRLSLENLEQSRAYHVDSIRPRRLAFYESVRSRTRDWLDETR